MKKIPDKPKIYTFVHYIKDTTCVTCSFSTLIMPYLIQERQYKAKSFHWIRVLTYLDNHSKRLPYKKLTKQRWSYLSAIKDNAKAKTKTSARENEYYVSRTAVQVERKQMKMSREVQGQVEKQLVRWKTWSRTFYPLTRQWSSNDILLETWSLIEKRAERTKKFAAMGLGGSQPCCLLWSKKWNWCTSFQRYTPHANCFFWISLESTDYSDYSYYLQKFLNPVFNKV